jgi:hypothetical protein
MKISLKDVKEVGDSQEIEVKVQLCRFNCQIDGDYNRVIHLPHTQLNPNSVAATQMRTGGNIGFYADDGVFFQHHLKKKDTYSKVGIGMYHARDDEKVQKEFLNQLLDFVEGKPEVALCTIHRLANSWERGGSYFSPVKMGKNKRTAYFKVVDGELKYKNRNVFLVNVPTRESDISVYLGNTAWYEDRHSTIKERTDGWRTDRQIPLKGFIVTEDKNATIKYQRINVERDDNEIECTKRRIANQLRMLADVQQTYRKLLDKAAVTKEAFNEALSLSK